MLGLLLLAAAAPPLAELDALLTPPPPAETRLVRRGQPVTIRVRSAGLTIALPGRALADGRAGDSVRVLALPTRRTLDARVEPDGAVRVALPL